MNNINYLELINNFDIVNKSENEIFDIPIAISDSGELITIEIKEEYGVTLVVGKLGTGKTTIVRLMIAYLLQNKLYDHVEIFLANGTRYEFSELTESSLSCIKDSLLGMNKENMEEFIDKLYVHFLEKQKLMSENNWTNAKKMPITLVFMDDAYMMSDHMISLKYVEKLKELIAVSWICGFRFIFFSQNYPGICNVMPLEIQQRITRKILLSPYTKKEATDFFDEDIVDSEERFSIVVKRRAREQLEKGKLFYISSDEFRNVVLSTDLCESDT